MHEHIEVPIRGGHLHVVTRGAPGHAAVLLHPSLGRWARDFDPLVDALVDTGYRTIALDPRGVSTGAPLDGVTMRALVDDVTEVLDALDAPRAHMVGHAFGNRVVRSTAALHHDRVATVTLLGAGGRVAGDDTARAALPRCFDMSLPWADRRDAIATAFFAPANDAAVWVDGWFPDAYRVQGAAAQGPLVDGWWDAGGAPMLVVQGAQDRIAPPANGRALAAERRAPTELVEIDGAGHALLPERPAEIAAAVIGFLRRFPSGT